MLKVRNKKTKQVKTLPISVYRNINPSKWELLSEDEQPIAPTIPTADVKKNELNESAPPAETGDVGQTFNVGSDRPSVTVVIASDLHAEYETLSGTKPDKRWGIEKLKSKIEELKATTENEGE